ncbi:MAG: zinc ribbon domain-containing protein [gamma proteobacterium symbiont of Taylorina sp.]|nr:zinc ribbon domain-containing protein [gamma proteobacterium symbiont of Taylorina sp.]
MPIYEYRCNGCGHEMELIQRMSEDPMKDCPVCKESKLKKLISAAGFQLKGSGWYETDFKGNNKTKSASNKSSSSSSSCGGGSCGCA